MFDLARLTAANLVAQIDHHESLGSTSDRALQLAAAGVGTLPLLVLTERADRRPRPRDQSLVRTGRGADVVAGPRRSALRTAAGSLARGPLATGLAVCEALQSLAPSADVQVKWPNDVYLAGRKICGILLESVPGWRDRLVVGIGVNVNNRSQESGGGSQESVELRRTAIALIDYDKLPRHLTAACWPSLTTLIAAGANCLPAASHPWPRCIASGAF